MGASSHGNRRHIPGFNILMPVLAGVLVGFAGFVVKAVVSEISLTPTFLFHVLQNPLSYLAGFLGLAGFLIFQKSLYRGKVTTITPIMNGLSILVPVVLAGLFLAESLPATKIVGIALIVAGIAGLR